MKTPKRTFVDRVKGILAVFIIASCLLVLWIFWSSRNDRVETDQTKEASQKHGLVIGKIKHSATRNGKVEWELEASSAEYINEKKEAILHDLSLTFYLKNNEKAFLYAKEGILKTDKNDIVLTGNVTMDKGGYNFQTERLTYSHEHRWIASEAPVKFKGDFFHLTADMLKIDLNTSKTLLKGHVKGTFDERIEL